MVAGRIRPRHGERHFARAGQHHRDLGHLARQRWRRPLSRRVRGDVSAPDDGHVQLGILDNRCSEMAGSHPDDLRHDHRRPPRHPVAVEEGPQPTRLLFEEATGEAGATGLSVASCTGSIRPSSQHARSSTCRLQAAAGPDASFFLTFDGGKRQAINPYEWIDKTIIDHRPEPEPEPVQPVQQPMPATECPKLRRMRELIAEEEAAKAKTNLVQRQSAAIERWRYAPPGDGNDAFFQLGVDLDRTGMSPAEIDATLWQEAGYGRHPSERRAQIKYIMRSLRGSPCRLAA